MIESNIEKSILKATGSSVMKENDEDKCLLTFIALDAQNASESVYETCSKVFPCGMKTIKARESLRKYDYKLEFDGLLDSFVH